jgi:hypothetical protein
VAGMKYYYVEQGHYVNSPLEDIQQSFKYLQQNILG